MNVCVCVCVCVNVCVNVCAHAWVCARVVRGCVRTHMHACTHAWKKWVSLQVYVPAGILQLCQRRPYTTREKQHYPPLSFSAASSSFFFSLSWNFSHSTRYWTSLRTCPHHTPHQTCRSSFCYGPVSFGSSASASLVSFGSGVTFCLVSFGSVVTFLSGELWVCCDLLSGELWVCCNLLFGKLWVCCDLLSGQLCVWCELLSGVSF